jgi:hypothetical protein
MSEISDHVTIGEANRQRLDKHEHTLETISQELTTVRKDLDSIKIVWSEARRTSERNHTVLGSLLGVTVIGVFGFFGQIVLSARWAATTDAMLAHMSQSQTRLEAISSDHERRLRSEEISPH